MDAIQLVKKDHRAVEQLFKRFERAEKADRSAEMKKVVRALVKELSVHAAIEEQLLYPTLRQTRGEDDEILEALEEHHLVKLTLLELDKMGPDDERFCAKVTVLMENVRHHVKEEEHELLPRLKKALEPADLRQLGEAMKTLKRAAPTRPHPASPDTPPGNFLTGAVAALYDRSRDAVRDMAERGRARGRRAMQPAKDVARGAVDGAGDRGPGAGRTRRAGGGETHDDDQPSLH